MSYSLRLSLLVVLVSVGIVAPSSLCPKYATLLYGNDSNASEASLVSAIVTRFVFGGSFQQAGSVYNISGVLTDSPSNPIRIFFTGAILYRPNAPDYTRNGYNNTDLAALAGHIISYFAALWGCTTLGSLTLPAVNTYNMYAVHAMMYLNSSQEAYFNVAVEQTLLSFGMSQQDVDGEADLSLFNRCGPPVATLNNTQLVQICGTADCPLATGATQATCVQYYKYPALSSSSSSTASSSSDAVGKFGTSVVVLVAVTALVVMFVL